MPDPSQPAQFEEFDCPFCQGSVRIPHSMLPATGPCPYCRETISCPAPESSHAPAEKSEKQTVEQTKLEDATPEKPPEPVKPVEVAKSDTKEKFTLSPKRVAPAVSSPPVEKNPPPPAKSPSSELEPVEQPAPIDEFGKPVSETTASTPVKIQSILIGIAALLMVIVGVTYTFSHFMQSSAPVAKTETKTSTPSAAPTTPPKSDPAHTGTAPMSDYYMANGWEADARKVLGGYLQAKTIDEKMAFLMPLPGLKERMLAFYGNRKIDETDTPISMFSPQNEAKDDKKRGIFLMSFLRPRQISIKKYFRPITTMKVEQQLEQPDILLQAVGNPENFMEEQVCIYAFFNHTKDGLKLDWDVFQQSRYETLKTFAASPKPGQTGVFRIVLSEDIADDLVETPGARIYRMSEPSNPQAFVKVLVMENEAAAAQIADLNWRRSTKIALMKTATVELKWSTDKTPRLILNKLVCWEFLGLGNKSDSPVPKTDAKPAK